MTVSSGSTTDTLNYSYDALQRLTSQTTVRTGLTLAKEYSYKNLSGNRTTTQVSGYTAKVNGSAVDSYTYTCLDTVNQLDGKSGYIGVSGGYLGYFGADAVFLPDNYEGLGINESSWIGAQVTAGFGVGADAHIMESNTVMSESFNVFDFFIGGIKKVGKFFKEAFQ